MSSHQFPEIERTCEQVGIIREGKLLAIKSILQLREAEYQTFQIEVESDEDLELLKESQLNLILLQGRSCIIRVAGELDSLWMALGQVHVVRFKQHSLELEEAFLDFYK